ncbi:hypothetical protein Rs2_37878 [Raphanus sativus]|nr:hypothetical protein Rs2_37878 [Raphanus sativus]
MTGMAVRSDIVCSVEGIYDIMRYYIPKVGSLGLDMMLRTCTVQVNLDFSSEADMIRKFRANLALQTNLNGSVCEFAFYQRKAKRVSPYEKVPVTGLKTPFTDWLLKHVAKDVLKLAKVCTYWFRPVPNYKYLYQNGLERRGYKEAGFLNAVDEVVRTGSYTGGGSVGNVQWRMGTKRRSCVSGTAVLKNETRTEGTKPQGVCLFYLNNSSLRNKVFIYSML